MNVAHIWHKRIPNELHFPTPLDLELHVFSKNIPNLRVQTGLVQNANPASLGHNHCSVCVPPFQTVSYTQFLLPTNAFGTRRNTIDSTSSFSQFRSLSHRSLSIGRTGSTQGSLDAGNCGSEGFGGSGQGVPRLTGQMGSRCVG